jgi:hypothetical protein
MEAQVFNPPLLAGQGDAIAFIVIVVIAIVAWISKMVGEMKPKQPPIANRNRPQVRNRDNRLQEEINIFLEDNGGRQNPPARPSRPPARPQPASSQPASSRKPQRRPEPVATQPAKKNKKIRPGEDLSRRQAPVANNLGTGVQQSLSQHMPERITQEMQQRLASRVDEKVTADLGTTDIGGGAQVQKPVQPIPLPRAERFAQLLRTPGGMQQAIVMNLILSPPPGRAGRRPG